MRKISDEVREKIIADPLMQKCMRKLALDDHDCHGRITWEHALLYAGRQIDEAFAIIGLCAYAHSVDEFQDTGILDKSINEWIAINRMTKRDDNRYDRFDWKQRRDHLNRIYGKMTLK